MFFPLLTWGAAQTPPADEAVAAVMKVRSRPEYTWEISTLKPGDPAARPLPRTVHGGMTANGEMLVEHIWADGLVLETISRRDGAAAVHTPDGWFSKTELKQPSSRPRPGQSKWLSRALEAMDTPTPEEELTHLLNDCDSISWEKNGEVIDATLTQRGASYWLASGRLVPNATGKIQLRLRDGFVRECRFSAEGDQPQGGSTTLHISVERAFTFNYSARPPPIAEEAKLKLESSVRR